MVGGSDTSQRSPIQQKGRILQQLIGEKMVGRRSVPNGDQAFSENWLGLISIFKASASS
jgi:hypothetical protein